MVWNGLYIDRFTVGSHTCHNQAVVASCCHLSKISLLFWLVLPPHFHGKVGPTLSALLKRPKLTFFFSFLFFFFPFQFSVLTSHTSKSQKKKRKTKNELQQVNWTHSNGWFAHPLIKLLLFDVTAQLSLTLPHLLLLLLLLLTLSLSLSL